MGVYLADVAFDEGAIPTWEAIFERAKVRFDGPCTLATRPEPGRREHARMSAGRGEDIDLHRHDGKISFSHGPRVFPFARAVHRALADFGGDEEGFDRVTLVPGETRVSLHDLMKKLGRFEKVELAFASSFDPPLDTAHGPLLAEGSVVVDKAAAVFELRVHHRSVRIARRKTLGGEEGGAPTERGLAHLDALWKGLLEAFQALGCVIASGA